jgi:hypothetical protein
MDLVTSAKDVLAHFWVPVTSLVTEVGASFKQVAHTYFSHFNFLCTG